MYIHDPGHLPEELVHGSGSHALRSALGQNVHRLAEHPHRANNDNYPDQDADHRISG